jgi:hypothetical protein
MPFTYIDEGSHALDDVMGNLWSVLAPGGGGGSVPLRVGASSTSYGWALGAADLLVPGAARFEMRAVSAVTLFVVPPDVVAEIMRTSPRSEAAIW